MSSDENSNKIIDSLNDALRRFGHIYALVIVAFIMLYTRLQGRENLVSDSGDFALLGNDSWYHYRATQYTIENFPFTIGIDPKTGYPEGADVGTFGTLYDQIHATLALIIGAGDPSQELVRQILAYSSPVFAVLVVAAVYFLTKYITRSRWTGVTAAGIITLLPGTFYDRTVVGFAQHHVLEVLFILVAVLLTIKALDRAERENIIWELIETREVESLKPWGKAVGLAALAILIYYLTWPPAMMYFGLLAMAAGLYALATYNRKTPAEPALLTFATLLLASLVFVLIQIPQMETSVSNPSLLHLGVAGISFGGIAYVLLVNHYANAKNWSYEKFVGSTVGAGILAVVILAVLQPSVVDAIFGEVMRLLGYPFGVGGDRVHTIAEEQTTGLIELTLTQYGLMLGTAIAGMVLVAVDGYQRAAKNKGFASQLFLVVVGVFFLVISLRTVRFNYYLAPFVAIFAAITLQQIVQLVGIPSEIDDIEGYQVIALLLIVTLVVPVLFLPVEGTVFTGENERVNIHEYQEWEEPLMWLDESTEHDGIPQYESSDEQPPEYGDDAYGVMSWWDYGHWITVTGERSPVANPFQQQATEASEFLLADDPDEAESVIEEMDEDAEARYVAVDWQMASPSSKFQAMTQFNEDVTADDFVTPYYSSPDGTTQELAFFERDQQYYETMMARLYFGHGSQMEPGPYTIDYELTSTETGESIRTVTPQQEPITVHNSTDEAQEHADEETEVAFNGFGMNPPETVEALENYRLVKSSSYQSIDNAMVGMEYQQIDANTDEEMTITEFEENPSSVKLFERVSGAEITGDGADPGETVSLSVTVNDPATDATFTYDQDVTVDEQGEFTATVPYSTTGYDDAEYPPEVEAVSEYSIETSDSGLTDTVSVPEEYVLDEEADSIEVTLTEDDE